MEMIAIITALSVIMWYVIDRFKQAWDKLAHGKYITIIVSLVLAALITLGFKIDLIFALQLYADITIAGQVLTILVLMSGSSAVSEIISRIKGKA